MAGEVVVLVTLVGGWLVVAGLARLRRGARPFLRAGLADGQHTLDAQARDGLGHELSTAGSFDVLVDNTAPSEPSLTHADQPDAGTWWDGTAAVTATTSDRGTAPAGDWGSGIERLELLDGDEVIATESYTCDDTISGRCRESETHAFDYTGAQDPPAGTVQLGFDSGQGSFSVRLSDELCLRSGRLLSCQSGSRSPKWILRPRSAPVQL